jgi:hypothetical protein
MSQHDFNIANQTFPSFRSDLNDALQAAATMSAGSSAPTTPYAYQLWFDTTTDTWKVRNSGNTAWISTITTDLATGKVGIGTTTPDENLQVFQTANSGNNYNQGRIKVGGTTSVLGFQMAYTAQSSGRASLTSLNPSGTSNNRIYIGFGALDSGGEPATSVMTLNQTGNAGFGTNLPIRPVHAKSVSADIAVIERNGAGNAAIRAFNSSAETIYFGLCSGGGFAINDISNISSSPFLKVDANGKVGIGTSSPSSKLHVEDTTGSLSSTKDITAEFRRFDGTYSPRLQIRHSTAGTDIHHTYSSGASNLTFSVANSEGISINTSGEVTKPNQPSFSVVKTSDQTLSTTATVTITWETELWDTNSDFTKSTNQFTAPVTGKYYLQAQARIDNLDTAAVYYIFKIQTSNRTRQEIVDPEFATDLTYYTMSLSSVFDMDAGDTAYVSIAQNGGTASHVDDGQSYTSFSGYLLG